jgi:LmbE family N-acetylglucosaminyl deacetylase
MSNSRIIVTEKDGVFHLRTERGYVLGPRLYSVAPEGGKVLPDLKDEFENKLAATRAAMDWNVYLLWAWKKRAKSRERSAD